jgi:ribosomal protein S18 acetylase RimI-like enzyme
MDITYSFVDGKEFREFFRKNRQKIFKADFDFNISPILSENEKENRAEHWKRQWGFQQNYYLIAKDQKKIVGWSFGSQVNGDDFYMINSAVFPKYRKQGIYSIMLRRVVKHVSRLGFQRIYSRHKMSNNEILIPKLKFGFVITGFQINDQFGNLVELSYYLNKKRRELLEVRIGSKKITDDIIKLIK